MKRTHVYIFIGLLICYLALAFGLPTNPEVLEKYSLSQTGARLLNVTILLPITFVYLAALYGYYRFKSYSLKIKNTKEGPYFNEIANGLMVLAFSLPINSIIGSLVNYAKFSYPDIYPVVKLGQNYLTLVLWVIGIVLVSKGAEGLYSTLRRKNNDSEFSYAGLLIPIALASIFSWLITAYRPDPSISSEFIIPAWARIATLAVPYVYIWCVGIRTSFILYKYQNRVKGSIYKKAFNALAKGFGIIIIISIAVQFISVLSEQINRLDLSPLLAILYILVIVYAVGYGLIARGAGKLKQIEEV